ncbi:MAG: CDGSH iron-sulfur domain-containing protein [Luteitalea sp.]|nr:CDGSH iron-sulfur domain-containing protein [Luteitalea sp.]
MGDFKVIVRNNGPYRLEGEGITICDQEGRVYGLAGRTVVSLCRCGHSANKPFCDGTHNKVGFQSECQAHELPPPQAEGVVTERRMIEENPGESDWCSSRTA